MTRILHRINSRSYQVLVDGEIVGVVWHPVNDVRWRASDPTGQTEWRPWTFYRTPQAAAVACVDENARISRNRRSPA